MPDIENHMLSGESYEEHAGFEPCDRDDEDTLYEEMRQRSIDEAAATHSSLRVRLGLMIRHISKKNSFDKRELVQLLKDAQRALTPIKSAIRRQAE